MIRELLLVNSNRWPENPPVMPDVDLGEPFDVKPIAWPVGEGMSHRGYVLLLTAREYEELKKRDAIEGVTIHRAGTKAKPIPIEDVLASVGLEPGGRDDE